jgi:aminopeptidase-like protein
MIEKSINDEIQAALEDLFPLARSITGDANRETLYYLKKIYN